MTVTISESRFKTKYCNYNSEIILFLFLDIIDHITWSTNNIRSLAKSDSISNNIVEIILVHLSLTLSKRPLYTK